MPSYDLNDDYGNETYHGGSTVETLGVVIEASLGSLNNRLNGGFQVCCHGDLNLIGKAIVLSRWGFRQCPLMT